MEKAFDVIVVGGGIAGVASALSATRDHKKVAIIEKQCVLGGLATSGLIAIYLPICDGFGHQVSFGISEELLRLSIKMGYKRKYPKAWLENGSFIDKTKQRFEVQYNPNYFALSLEELLLENGVSIYYDALLSKVNLQNGLIESISMETLVGEIKLKAKAFVDASGDAKLAFLAKEKTRVYQKGNIVACWYYYLENGNVSLNKLGVVEQSDSFEMERKSEKPLTNSRFFGGSFKDENDFILQSHQQTLIDINKKRLAGNDFEVTTLPMMPEMRMTRCLDGEKIVLDDKHNKCSDSVGVIADWRRRGYIYELPFRTLVSNIDNLFVAGRCINVDDNMWDVTRAIPCCAVSGQASGLAASIFVDKEKADISCLQEKLREQGQKLFIDEIITD